jgi:hypothetical protein
MVTSHGVRASERGASVFILDKFFRNRALRAWIPLFVKPVSRKLSLAENLSDASQCDSCYIA